MSELDFSEVLDGATKKQFAAIFSKFDKNGSGDIDQKELEQALRACDYVFSKENVSTILKIVDQNHNGAVDFNEFIMLMGYLYIMDQAFNDIDKNADGHIDRKELGEALRAVGYNFSEGQLKVLYKMADSDNSGKIELSEFHSLSLFLRFCRVIFLTADKDHSGGLDPQEFVPLLKALNIPTRKDIVDSLFKTIDVDKSGSLEFEEIVNLVFVLLFQNRNKT
mmetsp:Transcript_30809/g.34361  ORF Transcript_30809/g.34361 Transcript_30809/m.34361 type:complete len:222 (+) Transcript_30809:34-699(+)